MKNAILKSVLIILLAMPMALLAQKSSVDSFFSRYSDQKGYTSVEVTKGLFELFTEMDSDDPEFEDFRKAVAGLESLKLLAYSAEKGSMETKEKFYKDIMSSIPFNEYKELMVIRDSDANVNFYAKNNQQVITDMIMVVDGKEQAVILNLTGTIDLNYVAKLGKSMNFEGMNYLEKMKKK
jgi:hypothetical protein